MFLSKNSIILFLLDMGKGTKVKNYLRFYNEVLNWQRVDISKYQFKKFKLLIEHAYNNIPYYKELMIDNHLTPNSINTFDDIKKIPPLTRSDIQNNLDKLVSKKIKKFKSSSSGTTGIPISYYNDLDSQSAGMAALLFSYQLSKWTLGKNMLHIWGNESSIQRWKTLSSKLKQLLMRQKNLPSTIFNELNNFPDIIKLINKFKPDSIDGYTSSIYNLSLYLKEHNINLNKPKFVFTTAENLHEYQKEIIETSLGKVSDIYGCGEINGIAVRPVHSDKYYIIEPHVLVETETYNNELNEIIVTDLDNKLMPFIRYKIGDLIDKVHTGNENKEIKLNYFKKIKGRTSDTITQKIIAHKRNNNRYPCECKPANPTT